MYVLQVEVACRQAHSIELTSQSEKFQTESVQFPDVRRKGVTSFDDRVMQTFEILAILNELR